MTPGARAQAATDLLTNILASWQAQKRFPADKQLDMYFKSNRYIGSGDRGAISELVYWILRNKASISWRLEHAGAPVDARGMVIASLILRKTFNAHSILALSRDSKYSIAPLTPAEVKLCTTLETQPIAHPDMPDHVRLNFPEWLSPHLREAFGDDFDTALMTLNSQATTDLRANTLKVSRDTLRDALRIEGLEVAATPLSPVGIRLSKRAPVFSLQQFRDGWFEVQDEGSQIVAQIVDAKPGMRVIDFCAGAGGKTLAIAAQMENKGRILAWDISQKRLSQIILRLRRAGVSNVQTHAIESEHDSFIKRHKYTADRVLVDAPCSGTGTWRRNPDLKWRFTAQDLQDVTAVQQSILVSAARLVKPGGRLIYATCSVLKSENENQVAEFLRNVKDFRVVCAQKIWDKTLPEGENDEVSYLWVTPHKDGADGFFAAVLERLPGAKTVEENEQTVTGS